MTELGKLGVGACFCRKGSGFHFGFFEGINGNMEQAIGNVGLIFRREVVGNCRVQLDREPQKSSDL